MGRGFAFVSAAGNRTAIRSIGDIAAGIGATIEARWSMGHFPPQFRQIRATGP